MVNDDSEILDFYPEDFQIDMNGKKMIWQGVALLPFIDQKRLLDALSLRYSQLSDAEVARNGVGNTSLFVSDEHPLYNFIAAISMDKTPAIDVGILLSLTSCHANIIETARSAESEGFGKHLGWSQTGRKLRSQFHLPVPIN